LGMTVFFMPIQMLHFLVLLFFILLLVGRTQYQLVQTIFSRFGLELDIL